MKIGLQLYTLRAEMERDFVGGLRKVAEIGYEGVEFAGYGGLSPVELGKTLDELGLKALGSHISYENLLSEEQFPQEMAYCRELGMRYAIIPYLQEKYRADENVLAETLRNFAHISEKCSRHGVQLCYHNHDFEFSQTFAGTTLFDTIFARVPEHLLQVELDTCWAHYAGADPVAVMRKYRNRLPLVHLKDLRREEGKPLTVELGQGEVNVGAIIAAAKELGVEWAIVEQDTCINPPFLSVAASMNWLIKGGYTG
ncbi:MAG TPA: sugar phosphate isomerase/epimerase [Bacilli bacterium]